MTKTPTRRNRPRLPANPDLPQTLTLPDGRRIYVEVPGEMTAKVRGETMLLPAAMKFLDKVRALATKVSAKMPPRPAHIAALRDALGLTQAQFAEQLGVDKLTISRWERGQMQPGESSLERLAQLQAGAVKRGVILA